MTQGPHFNIIAAVVKQLGEELISDEVTALIELIKNAYDADASYANVVVDTNNALDDESLHFREANGEGVPKGYIIVEDDGIGMGREEIEKGWLTISYSHKRRMRQEGRLTPKKKRTPLGDKGLGRLSTQRLGHRLEMFTCREKIEGLEDEAQVGGENESRVQHHVAFDWRDFTEEASLTTVPVHFCSEPKEKPRHGTRLVVTGLREPGVWLGEAQGELVGQLSQLIFPFAEVRPFNVYLTINGVRCDLETIAESIRGVAVSRFAFSFDENGDKKLKIHGKIRLTRLKGIRAETEEAYNEIVGQDQGREFFAFLTNPQNKFAIPNVEYVGREGWLLSFEASRDLASLGRLALDDSAIASPGKFHGEIDEFFLRGVNLEPIQDVFSRTADYRDFVSRHVGVRIFRDGFGIRPYGLEGNDWLNLGGAQTSGRSFYAPRPQNVIGYVALTASENTRLEEKTDREGFVNTPYSRNFFLMMDTFVEIVAVFFNNLRRSYNEYRKQCAEKSPEFLSAPTFFRQIGKMSTVVQPIEGRVNSLDTGLDELTGSIHSISQRAERSPLLASEDERELSPILSDAGAKLAEARHLIDELRPLVHRLKRLQPAALSLEARFEILQDQLAQFSELAGLGLTAEALSHEIHTVADRLAERTKALNDRLRRRQSVDAEIIAYTEDVYSAISTLRKQLSHLAPSLRYVRERKDRIGLREFFVEMREYYAGRFKRFGIQFDLDEPFDDFTIIINKGKLTQIVDNLILNSEYWLREATRRRDITDPKIAVRSKRPLVEIYDNGMGVDPSVEFSMFQPFVTTKPKNMGRGLGLFIVRELLDSSGCRISLLPDRNSFGRRYTFQIDFAGVVDGQ